MAGRRKFLLYMLGLVVVVVGFVYPAALPAASFDGWRRDASDAALQSARTLLEHPLERLLVLRLRVIDVEDKGVVEPDGCGSQHIRVDHDFEAKVDALTLFGIRMAQVVVTCRGAGRA